MDGLWDNVRFARWYGLDPSGTRSREWLEISYVDQVSISTLNKNVLFLENKSLDLRNKLLHGNPIFLEGHPIKFIQWSLNFNPNSF